MTRSTLLLLMVLAAPGVLGGCQTVVSCPAGQVACADHCVDPQTDVAHCGACGTACDGRATCQAGSCQCGPGLTGCGAACADLASDPAHCGTCGTACGAGQVCLTGGGATTCAAACTGTRTACGGACVDLATDRYHCGACDRTCAPGAACVDQACRSFEIACFATDEVRGLAPDLATRSSPRPAGDGPIALAQLGADVWAAASLSGSLVRLPLDPALAGAEVLTHGKDYELVTAAAGKLLVSNAGAGSVVIFDPAAQAVVDEIPLGGTALVNPRGIAVVGAKAYVALYGDSASGDPAVGQAVAVLDASGLASCGTAARPGHCLTVQKTLGLSAGADAPGRPFPGRAVALGGKVYVVLANLKKGSFGYYTDPAGPGRLAVIDAADDSVTFLSLGAGCGNPGGLALQAETLWVACGAFGQAGLVSVALGAGAPAVSAVHPVPVGAPGSVAFCGQRGLVTDQYSGQVYLFDPADLAGSPASAVDVCPTSPGPTGYAWAADAICAVAP